MTLIGEQAINAEKWDRIQVDTRGPAVRRLLASAEIQAVDVRYGTVRVYLILDKASIKVDLASHLRSTLGVTEVSIRTVTVPTPKETGPQPDDYRLVTQTKQTTEIRRR